MTAHITRAAITVAVTTQETEGLEAIEANARRLIGAIVVVDTVRNQTVPIRHRGVTDGTRWTVERGAARIPNGRLTCPLRGDQQHKCDRESREDCAG